MDKNDYGESWYNEGFHRDDKCKPLAKMADDTFATINYICYIIKKQLVNL